MARLGLALTTLALALAAVPAGAKATAHACRTGDLYVSRSFSSGAAGHVVHVFQLRNFSGATCRMSGWLGVRLLGERGRPLTTRPKRVTRDVAGKQRRRRVTLRPGHTGSFRISTVTGDRCVEASAIRVGAPGASGRVNVPLGRRTIVACQRGRIFVAPVQPGNRAKPAPR